MYPWSGCQMTPAVVSCTSIQIYSNNTMSVILISSPTFSVLVTSYHLTSLKRRLAKTKYNIFQTLSKKHTRRCACGLPTLDIQPDRGNSQRDGLGAPEVIDPVVVLFGAQNGTHHCHHSWANLEHHRAQVLHLRRLPLMYRRGVPVLSIHGISCGVMGFFNPKERMVSVPEALRSLRFHQVQRPTC